MIFFSRKKKPDTSINVIPKEYQDKMTVQNMRKMHTQGKTSLQRGSKIEKLNRPGET